MKFKKKISLSIAALIIITCMYINPIVTNAETAGNILINQVCGTGKKSDSRISHSFIELYNPASAAVDMTGWRIEYQNDGDGNDGVIKLDASITANGKYFIKGFREIQSSPDFPLLDFTNDNTDCDLFIPSFVLGNKNCKITLFDNNSKTIDGFGRGSLKSTASEGSFAVAEGSKHTVYARKSGVDTNKAVDFTAYNFNSNSAAAVLQSYKQSGLMPGNQALSFSFSTDFAKPGEQMRIRVANGDVSDYIYTWKSDGVVVSNTNTYTPKQSDMHKWLTADIKNNSDTVVITLSMYCSNLPVIYINVEENAEITTRRYHRNAEMHVQGNSVYNNTNTTLYTGATEIKGRGNYTWTNTYPYGKKPYKLKLGVKTDLLNMGASKHWLLIANYYDRSLLRDKLAYDLSGRLGIDVHMKSTWVELVVNGRYDGNYRLTEQVRVSPDRVDIFDWEAAAEDAAAAIAKSNGFTKTERSELSVLMEENLEWITTDKVTFKEAVYTVSKYYKYPKTTGGFLLELDEFYDEISKFKTEFDQPIMFKSPEFANTNSDMIKFAEDNLNAFSRACFSADFHTDLNGKKVRYNDIFDMDSLVDYFLMCEIFLSWEPGFKSTFMYKDIDTKFKMGPIWDMDWSAAGWGTTKQYTLWKTTQYSKDEWWYSGIVTDPYFIALAQEKFWRITDALDEMLMDGGIIDTHYEYLKNSAAADKERWKYEETFTTEVEFLKTWLKNRTRWLSTRFASPSEAIRSLNVYKPAAEIIILFYNNANNTPLRKDTSEIKPQADVLFGNTAVIANTETSMIPAIKAEFYLNGKKIAAENLIDGKASTVIENALLSRENINLVEVIYYNQESDIIARNYKTLRYSKQEILKGDINLDGKINGMDLLLMKQHILDVPGKKIAEGTPTFDAADMNDDGKINGMDLLLLKKKILGI